MKWNALVWLILLLSLSSAVHLLAQGTETDKKLFDAIKAKAEKGDAVTQAALGDFYFYGGEVRKDAFEAGKWYRKAAEQGFAYAQCMLGECYNNGWGVMRDAAEAVKWFRESAEQGYADAEADLGTSYATGDGVMEDMIEAAKWFRKSAEQGSAAGEYNWGICYAKGYGVTKDVVLAVKWYRRAADQGSADAQRKLGESSLVGIGAPKDYAEAYKWCDLASAQGDKQAKQDLFLLETLMSPEQIAEAQRFVREFKPHVTRRNDLRRKNKGPVASGTGFFITEDGFLITNEHVAEEATQIRLVTGAGFISAKVVKVNAANDVALLKAEGKFKPLPIAASRSVKLGNTVATIGFPNVGLQGFAPKLAKGEIASLSGAQDDARYFQISVPVQPGNSGGALVDERGNVVGVVSARLNAAAALTTTGVLPENVNYAVKSSFLLSFLESAPEVSAKLKEPETKDRKFEDVVKSAEQAAVLVLVY